MASATPGAGILDRLRNVASVLIAGLLVLALAGCQAAPGEQTAAPPANPLIYEIASADGAVEGWMLGTIHALPQGTRWQTPAIEEATRQADILVVEIAALDDRPALSRIFSQLGTTAGQPPLDRRLPSELHDRLAALLDRGDMTADQFTATESWAAALMLAQIDSQGDPEQGVDRALIRRFPADRVRELEGARGQLAIFDALPERAQRKLLAAVVAEAQAAPQRGEELRQAWLTGDETALVAATSTGITADPGLREALLVARNRRWDTAIASLLERPERPLIAVGAAHLVGPDGLAALLEARGYRLKRLG